MPRDTWTVAIWTVRPGCEDEFIAVWTAFLDWTIRYVPGVLGGTRLFQGTTRPNQFFSPMHWESAEAITAWQAHPESRLRLEALRALAEDDVLHTMVTVADIRPAQQNG